MKAHKADQYGNLVFRGTARNFNPEMASASRFCIAEVEEIVDSGELHPDHVHLPGIFVDAIVPAPDVEKRIESLCISNSSHEVEVGNEPSSDHKIRLQIARRAALELRDGMNANLGIGIPTLASNFLPKQAKIMLQTENGLIGMGPYPTKEQVDADWVNAGRLTQIH